MSVELVERIRENFPRALQELPIWLLWRLENVEGEKPKKIPYYADHTVRRDTLDSPEDRARLVTFEAAAKALCDRIPGLGVALGEVPGEEMRVCGIDLDDCFRGIELDDCFRGIELDDCFHIELDERAVAILGTAESYAEKSPSGKGLHILGFGDIGTRKKEAGLEIYSGKRFFTVTGQAINRAKLADLSDAAAVAREVFRVEAAGSNGAGGEVTHESPGSIPAGARNNELTSLAGKLRRVGSTEAEILAGLVSHNAARCNPPLPESELRSIAHSVARYPAGTVEEPAPRIVLRHIADIVAEQREAQWLAGLHKILERRVLAILAGSRNTFKSFIAHHWAMTAALSGESVVILSAEGAGLDRRTDAWMRTFAPAVDLRSLKLRALERAVNLNSSATLEALQEAIGEDGELQKLYPALIVIDTYSKFAPGLDENDNAAVALYLSLLTSQLRDFLPWWLNSGCSVLLVAHAGHADAKRPRGASVLMANPDAEYIVERSAPTAMTATVTRERFKDSAALPPLAYRADVVDLGRLDSHGEPVTSLVMRDADAPAVMAARRPELHGRAQRQLLAALRAQATGGEAVWTLADMREAGRKAGLHRNTARSAAEALTFTPHLAASVGGWRLTEAPSRA